MNAPASQCDTTERDSPSLSICITFYEADAFLRECLSSIEKFAPSITYEVLIVDDASPHPCPEDVVNAFQHVRLIRSRTNLGFAAANNLAIRSGKGRNVLILNSDTVVHPGALDALVRFLDDHPDAGAVGPKILNADGSFQPQCKRGMLSPWSGLIYNLGLNKLLPKSRIVGEYLLTWTDPDAQQDVKGLSGACMCVRRVALDQVGLMDESFGMYGEDLDLCYRIGAAGWRVCYLPSAQIVHHGGKGGSASLSYRNLYLYHRALWLIFSRYPQSKYFPAYGWLVWLIIGVRFASCILANLIRREKRVGTAKGDSAPGRSEAY